MNNKKSNKNSKNKENIETNIKTNKTNKINTTDETTTPNEVSFIVHGKPLGKGRPRFTKVGNFIKAYTPRQTRDYESLIRYEYLFQVGSKKLNGEIEADIVGIFPVGKSETKKRKQAMLDGKIRHTKKIDCDNLAKTILDALNDVAYDDDRQVCKLSVEKIYGEEPRVEVRLKEIENYQKIALKNQ